MPKAKETTNKGENILSARMLAFVANFDGSNAVEAARTAGYASPRRAAKWLMALPKIQAAIALKQSAIVQEVGRRVGGHIEIGPIEVINRLAEVSRLKEVCKDGTSANLSAITAALRTLADIFGLRTKLNAANIFDGWTPQERIRYADTGDIPPRFAGAVSAKG